MPASKRPFRIASWNVNGLRASAAKGFAGWLAGSGAEVVGVQEVRAQPEQLTDETRSPPGFRSAFHCGKRKGYSGVGLFMRSEPDALSTSMSEERFDDEGRLQLATFGKLLVANVYFPNGNGKGRDNSRIPYKLAFYRRLFDMLERPLRDRKPAIVMGDFNTAHREIDLARPKQNVETSGFRPEERAELDRWLEAGWVDSFRRFETVGGHYTWWSQRLGVREKNIGWRIDYALCSPAALPYLERATIHKDVRGSDHCPISVDLSRDVLTGA